MEDENGGQKSKYNQDEGLNLPNKFTNNSESTMCQLHKRKIEFVCLLDQCNNSKFLCPACKTFHEKHLNYIENLDEYAQSLMEREQLLFDNRKQIIDERVQQMRKIIKRISKSIERYEIDELQDIERQFDEITFRCQDNKYKFLKDFCNPHYDTTKLFTVPLFNKEQNYQHIQGSAQNMLNLIQKQEYNLDNLIGFLIRQDNLFDLVEKYNRQRSPSQNNSVLQNQDNNNQENIQDNNLQNNNNNNQQDNNNNNNQLNNQIQPQIILNQIEVNDQQEEENLNYDEQDVEEQNNIDIEELQQGDNIIQFDVDESEWETDSSESFENDRTITSLLKLNNNRIVFSDYNTIYYYNFATRKILNSVEFKGRVIINKIVKLSDRRIAVLLHREFTEDMIQPGFIMLSLHYEVYVLEINNNEVIKQRIFAQTHGLEIKDIIHVKNSQLIAILQEESSILLINSRNGKVVSQYVRDIQDADEFAGIFSCTFLSKVTINGVFYKYLIALNLIDGSYGLWDIMNNKYVLKKRLQNNIGQEYKQSTSVHIQDAFNIYLDQNKMFEFIQQKKNNQQQQQHLLVIQGSRNDVYLQRDFDGDLQFKMQHKLMDYFDLFYNQSAIPFYYSNCIFFYDFIQQKKIKTISLNTKFNHSTYLNQNRNQYIFNQINEQHLQNNQNNIENNQINNLNRIINILNDNQSNTSQRNEQTGNLFNNQSNNIPQHFNSPLYQSQTSSDIQQNMFNFQNSDQQRIYSDIRNINNHSSNSQQQINSISQSNVQANQLNRNIEQNYRHNSQNIINDVRSDNLRENNSQKNNKSKQKGQTEIFDPLEESKMYSSQISSKKSSKSKIYSSQSSRVSSKQKIDLNFKNKNNQYQQIASQQQNERSFSQTWGSQDMQFQQNQRNTQSTNQFNTHNLLNSQAIRNNNINNDSQFHPYVSHPVDALNNIEFGNPLFGMFDNEIQNLPEQNDQLQINNYKLFDVCPVGIINHYQFIVVVFPNGVIQYIK